MQASSQPTVSVIIPTLNEARNLPYVFARLPQGLHELILVDGDSVDDTPAAARRLRPDVQTIVHGRRGKSDALHSGFMAATGDIIVMLDADGSADPSEIPRFVSALLGGADFVKSTRFAGRGADRGITGSDRITIRLLSTLVNALGGTHYSDPCYGYIAFWRRHVPVLGFGPAKMSTSTRLWGEGFEVDTLINIRAARAGLTVREVACYGKPRIHEVGNLNAVNDGLRLLFAILSEERLSRRRSA